MQTLNVSRSIFGFPRSFLDLGDLRLNLKRYLLKDRFVHVSISSLVFQGLWKVALFYVAVLSLVWLLCRDLGRKDLAVLAVAFAGNFVLAANFEGGSPERYLPLYPFLFIAVALFLSTNEIPRVVRFSVCVVMVAAIAGNVWNTNVWRIHAEQAAAVNRLVGVLPLAPGSQIFVVGQFDNVADLRHSAPFHEINREPGFNVNGIYTPMMNTAHWRQVFAKRVLDTWERGGTAWVTSRLWSERPLPEWNWSEGDDKNLSWNEVVRFFGILDHTPERQSNDRFVMLVQSPKNRVMLQDIAKQE